MNLTDEQVLDHIINEHPAALAAKFRDGMRKYSTPLIEKDALAEAIPEVQDLVVYLSAATLQKKRAFELFAQLKWKLWSQEDDEMWTELEGLLEPKRLAVKKPDASAKEGEIRPAYDGSVEIFHDNEWRKYKPGQKT